MLCHISAKVKIIKLILTFYIFAKYNCLKMIPKKKVLFITYDGLTDPLGRSQIIPYLIGLSFNGYEITILSCEKKENYIKKKDHVHKILKLSNIRWKSKTYTKKPAVLSTMWDIFKLRTKAKTLHLKHNFDIIHCRSILSMLIGKKLQNKSTRIIFDIRGFWVEERVEGNLWNPDSIIFKNMYTYFKKFEQNCFDSADHIVTLTNKAKDYIVEQKDTSQEKVSVIPCSVDLNVFTLDKYSSKQIASKREKLGLHQEDFVLGYVGSLGTRYMLKEMIDFFNVIKTKKKNAKFLFVTNSENSEIKHLINKDILDSILFVKVDYALVPLYIQLFDVAIYFIKTGISGLAVSPTKQSELLAMGKTIISNKGIGDSDNILQENECGIIINEFTDDEYKKAVEKLPIFLNKDPSEIRKVAVANFSVSMAVNKYRDIYEKVEAQ